MSLWTFVLVKQFAADRLCLAGEVHTGAVNRAWVGHRGERGDCDRSDRKGRENGKVDAFYFHGLVLTLGFAGVKYALMGPARQGKVERLTAPRH